MKKIYDNDFCSVTQVLDVLRKIGLENWFKYNTIEFIKAESEKGKAIGITLHVAIQNHIEKEEISFETEYPEEVKTALQSFFLFKKENPDIKLKKSELSMTSEKYKYNGSLDCIATYQGQEIIMDWKTTNCKDKERPTIYAESHYQISSYVFLYNEVMKKNTDTAILVAFAKDKIAYNKLILAKKYMQECFEEVFLPALKIWYFQKKKENNDYGNSNRQRNSSITERSGRYSSKSDKLPINF